MPMTTMLPMIDEGFHRFYGVLVLVQFHAVLFPFPLPGLSFLVMSIFAGFGRGGHDNLGAKLELILTADEHR